MKKQIIILCLICMFGIGIGYLVLTWDTKKREEHLSNASSIKNQGSSSLQQLIETKDTMKELVQTGDTEKVFSENKQFMHSLGIEILNKYPEEVWEVLEPLLQLEDGRDYIIQMLDLILNQYEKTLSKQAYVYYLRHLGVTYDYNGNYLEAIDTYIHVIDLALAIDERYIAAKVAIDVAYQLAIFGKYDHAVSLINKIKSLPQNDEASEEKIYNYSYYILSLIGLEFNRYDIIEKSVSNLAVRTDFLEDSQEEYYKLFKELAFALLHNNFEKIESTIDQLSEMLMYGETPFYSHKYYLLFYIKGEYYYRQQKYMEAIGAYEEARAKSTRKDLLLTQYTNQLINCYKQIGNEEKVKELSDKLHNDISGTLEIQNSSLSDFILNNMLERIEYAEQSKQQKQLQAIFYSMLTLFIIVVSIGLFIMRKILQYDHVTGLLKRRAYVKEINKRLKGNQNSYVIVSVDIKNFKVINVTEGYKQGDWILKELSEILKEVVGKNRLISRTGNDVFSFVTTKDDYEVTILKLEELINDRISHNKIAFHIYLSVGIYEIQENQSDFAYMLDCADTARLLCKEKKQNTFVIFDESMLTTRRELFEIEEELTKGIERNEFYLNYQPKFHSTTKQLVGMEALIRWNNAKLGFVGPDRFISIAEQNGYINQLGRFVFEEVCKTLKEWQEKGYQVVPISLNLSKIELYQKDLIHFYTEMLEKYSIAPNLIEIEITESIALANNNILKQQIENFQRIGLKIAIDDFGTGDSNLSNLMNVDINTLKIDRSLVMNIEVEKKSQDILKMIRSLCDMWHIEIVCEGVETLSQIELLNTYGEWIIQGYVFSKPVDKEAVSMYLLPTKINKNQQRRVENK